jgi:hypothetical protein
VRGGARELMLLGGPVGKGATLGAGRQWGQVGHGQGLGEARGLLDRSERGGSQAGLQCRRGRWAGWLACLGHHGRRFGFRFKWSLSWILSGFWPNEILKDF